MKSGQHKLSNPEVIAIFLDPRPPKVIAHNYKISTQMISAIKLGHRYKELTALANDYSKSG